MEPYTDWSMEPFRIQISRNYLAYVIYFVWFCTKIIPNVSNNVKTQRNLHF